MSPGSRRQSRAGAARPAAALAAVAGLLIAGCGSVAAARQPQRQIAAAPPQLASSVSTAAGTSWAIVVMGGSSAQYDNFWQLFARPAGAVKWRQVTPAGVADNGGLVAGLVGPASLVTGFRPSQDLSFSPLAATADSGATWSSGSLVNPGLADVPDALAAAPDGELIALSQGGAAQLGSRLGAAWATLASARSLARTAAGRACGLTGLTAAAFGSASGAAGSAGSSGSAGSGGPASTAGSGTAGVPLLAGGCAHPGIAGIFALRDGTWQQAGPPLPAALAARNVDILRMATLGARTQALLQTGTGSAATVLAAWSDDGGRHWLLSAPLPIGTAAVRSASFGTGGAVGLVLGRGGDQGKGAGDGVTMAGPGASWRTLGALPRWTATLAVGPAGHIDALTAHASSFADWLLGAGAGAGAAAWRQVQALRITIPYGSSS